MKEQERDRMTDQGWTAMQQLLDQRMPRRRRRVAAWWWFAGLLLLPVLGVAGWQWYYPGSNLESQPPAVPLAPAPIAQQTLPGARQAAEPSAGTDNGPGINSTTFNKLSAAQTAEHRAESASRSFHPGKKDHRGPDQASTLPYKAAALPAETSPTAFNDRQALVTDNQSDFPAIAAGPVRASTLTNLPTPFQDLAAGKPTVDLPPYLPYVHSEIIKARRPAQWAFGVNFGVNSERLPRVNGGLVGLVADWQPLRHWGLRSGVQYAMQRLAADESLVTTITEDAYEKSSNSLSVFDQSGNYGSLHSFSSINTNILASVRRIHRIETPLLAYWQPLSSFRIYMGGTLNYTFLAQTSNRIFSDNQVFKVVSGRDEINRLATERLQRWQVKWQAGLGYKIGRMTELNASIQTTFPKISFKRSAELNDSNANYVPQPSNPIVQVRQLGVTLSGVVYF